MKLRSELSFPTLDESKVSRLANLAAAIDGARPGQWEDELEEFNQLAGTAFGHIDFQGISGGMTHESWVRNVLSTPYAQKKIEISQPELLEIVTRLCSADGEEHEQFFWLKLLETNLDPKNHRLNLLAGRIFR